MKKIDAIAASIMADIFIRWLKLEAAYHGVCAYLADMRDDRLSAVCHEMQINDCLHEIRIVRFNQKWMALR